MENLKQLLEELREPEYQAFAQSLLPGVTGLLGVRLGHLRRIARRLAREDWQGFLIDCGRDTFEEIMLQGMVIGYAKGEPEEILCAIDGFLPKIDNWSVCDSFCSGLKIAREHPQLIWERLQPYFFSDREFSVRFGVVMSLFYFIDSPRLPALFSLYDRVDHPGYYAATAVAWAVSMCYARFPSQTTPYLLHNALPDLTFRLALQKIIESRAVPPKDKEAIRILRGGTSPFKSRPTRLSSTG